MLESFRVADDMPIESDLVVQALDKVQIQVEDYSKATRSQIFKLDEVLTHSLTWLYSLTHLTLLTQGNEQSTRCYLLSTPSLLGVIRRRNDGRIQ